MSRDIAKIKKCTQSDIWKANLFHLFPIWNTLCTNLIYWSRYCVVLLCGTWRCWEVIWGSSEENDNNSYYLSLLLTTRWPLSVWQWVYLSVWQPVVRHVSGQVVSTPDNVSANCSGFWVHVVILTYTWTNTHQVSTDNTGQIYDADH